MELKNKTLIIATHSIQYLKYSDEIFLLDNGQITSRGPFSSTLCILGRSHISAAESNDRIDLLKLILQIIHLSRFM